MVWNHYHLKWKKTTISLLLYSWKIWWGIKFGGLADCLQNCQIKIHKNFLLTYIPMAILYQTTKFKSANTFAMAIWDPTTKFNSHQYFWLYGTHFHFKGSTTTADSSKIECKICQKSSKKGSQPLRFCLTILTNNNIIILNLKLSYCTYSRSTWGKGQGPRRSPCPCTSVS